MLDGFLHLHTLVSAQSQQGKSRIAVLTVSLFIDSDRPRYTIAMSAMAAFSLLCAMGAWAMRLILMRQNRKLALTDSPTTYPY